MATKWPYDGFELPARQAEPYRLWFEFLKLASKDPTVKIDKAFYRAWGPYEDLGFYDWWDRHGRKLFVVSVGVRVLASEESIHRADGELIVSIPLHQNKGRSLSQIKRLLDDNGAGMQVKRTQKAQFSLNVGIRADGGASDPSTRFLKNLPKVRLFMDLYQFSLKHSDLANDKRLESMSKDYVAWTNAYNRPLPEGLKREIPIALADYVRYLEKRGSRQRLALSEYNESATSNNRSQVARYLRKARKIAANVAQGTFPGRYE